MLTGGMRWATAPAWPSWRAGRRFAEEFDADLPSNDLVPFRREVTELATLPPRASS